jgi:cellulose synthase/poly-beta-1,6-N-acetylglucosamine synthase-like glycosyltransferase
VPASAVIPTRHRAAVFERTLRSLAAQSVQPKEIIVIDASDDEKTSEASARVVDSTGLNIQWRPARTRGAASQRNEGVALANSNVIWFFDDDILFAPLCAAKLWEALESDEGLGGVNAMIASCRYERPGRATRLVYHLIDKRAEREWPGAVLGPGVNVMPSEDASLPDPARVQWLNTTCTLYRREALPDPPFGDHFRGYSLCEDLTLSLTMAKAGWRLANARTARIWHDSQTGDHKKDSRDLSRMELVNRYHVMASVLEKRSLRSHLELAIFEAFSMVATVRQTGHLLSRFRGKLDAIAEIRDQRRRNGSKI